MRSQVWLLVCQWATLEKKLYLYFQYSPAWQNFVIASDISAGSIMKYIWLVWKSTDFLIFFPMPRGPPSKSISHFERMWQARGTWNLPAAPKKRVSAEPAILPQAGDLAERGCRTLAVRDTRRKDEHMAGYPLDIAHISVHIQIYVPYWAVLLK